MNKKRDIDDIKYDIEETQNKIEYYDEIVMGYQAELNDLYLELKNLTEKK